MATDEEGAAKAWRVEISAKVAMEPVPIYLPVATAILAIRDLVIFS
jgi:hypothetical protein